LTYPVAWVRQDIHLVTNGGKLRHGMICFTDVNVAQSYILWMDDRSNESIIL